MSSHTSSSTYRAITNRAKEYIDRHCFEELTLEQIAEHVFMSPFHFQRIFKQVTGDTPKEYVTRIRLDAAVINLRLHPEKSVFEVALDCGFSSQSTFARAFHQRFGMSATELRSLSVAEVINMGEPNTRKLLQDQLFGTYNPRQRKKFLASITVQRLEPISVIYVPTTMKSEKHLTDEFEAFASRVAAYDLATADAEYLGVMYDHPMHTPQEKCRYKVCLRVPPDMDVHPKFHKMTIDGGKYAVFPIRGNINAMTRLTVLFVQAWLEKSNYRMAHLYWFEKFRSTPTAKTYSTEERVLFYPIKPA